ncbi:MAG TPA: type II 3-dehydroquinate dehydratase [Limnobacter sp.]|nr:type II 3-dehydroquinate dehydratase [Limnobacter sp.]
MKKLLLINGPNLNLLGSREPEIYGHMTLTDIEKALKNIAFTDGFELLTFQSNHEGALIDRVHKAKTEDVQGIVINPGGYTHTSVALRDALAGVAIPFVEVHLSNVHKRESFRHHSYFSDQAEGVICGLGWQGYVYALKHLAAK